MIVLNPPRNYLILIVIAFASLWSGSFLLAQDVSPVAKRVLAIFVFKQSMPWPYRFEQSLRAALTSNPSYPIELDVEYADQLTFSKKEYLSKVIDLYRYKYKFSKQKVDLVLVIGNEFADLMLEYSEVLFGDIPVVLITLEQKNKPRNLLKPNMVSSVYGFDLDKMGPLIQSLLPKTENLFVISGDSLTDRKFKNLAAGVLAEFNGQFAVHYLDDFSVKELLLEVTQLPENSAILFLTVFRDANGQSFIQRDLMSKISEKANAPTFGVIDTYLGHGIVGGNLLSAENQGKRYAEIVEKMLKGEPLTNLKFKGKANQMMFDWRQLKRWSIDEDRLPAGSIVRYREASVWGDYKWTIVGVGAIIFAQAFALIGLTIQHRRRRLAEEESQRLRDERAHISRVLAMGEIAASLAHELNQPLSAIRSYAQAAQRFLGNDPSDPDEAIKALAGIVAGNRRAEEVIKRIRMALKKEPFKQSRLDVRDLIQEVIMLVRSKAKEQNILIRLEIAAGLPPVFGDHIQLQQVLLNLIINGIEAMAAAGGSFREIVVQASGEKSDAVMISVQDSGVGIDENQEDLLFDAFYTTKSEGMGMGLSISRSIIEDHGGRLWATRNPDKGTTFSFTVPIYEEDEK
ncbi:MAG: GHKL domain-containing protein [Deltaproteobacteria bacterium]|nr:GHKL domain-containing protein [Deltaproteobacteria bacterium]